LPLTLGCMRSKLRPRQLSQVRLDWTLKKTVRPADAPLCGHHNLALLLQLLHHRKYANNRFSYRELISLRKCRIRQAG